MATAVFPLRMASHQRLDTKGALAPSAASSSRTLEASRSTSPTDIPDTTGKPFKRIYSSLEQTLRTATRSKAKSLAPPPDEFATVKGRADKGKGKASGEDIPKDKERSGVLKRFESKVGLRSGKESVTPSPSPIPPPIIGKTKDGGDKNVKIQEHERVGGLTSFLTPSLRQASMSSPVLHLSSQALPSPKSQSAVPASSSSTTSVLVSPTRDRSRRTSLQPASKEISGPMTLARRDSRSNGNANPNSKDSKTPRRPPPLNSPSSPSIASPSPTPGATPRRGHDRPRTPDTPTPTSSARNQHKKAAASMGNISLNTQPSSPTIRASSPSSRSKPPSTRDRAVPPSVRGLISASTSNLHTNRSSPSPTPRSPTSDQRRPSFEAPRPSLDMARRPSIDAPRRPSIDVPHRPSIDTQRPADSTRRPSGETQRRPSVERSQRPSASSAAPRAASPTSPVRPRATSPNQRANSPSYAHNRHFNMSTTSLAPVATPEQRELIRSATSILCKELRKAPPHLSGSHNGLREWEEVEVRMQPLVRLERIWGKSGGTHGSSQLSVGGVGSGGLSTGGEERERRMFCEAMRDGFVLCQCVYFLFLLVSHCLHTSLQAHEQTSPHDN